MNADEESRFSSNVLMKPSARTEHNTHRDGDIYVGDDEYDGGDFGRQNDPNIWPTYPVNSSGEFVFQNPKKPPRNQGPGDGLRSSSPSRGTKEDHAYSDDSDSSSSDSSGEDDMYTVTSNPKVSHCTAQ